jgi:hypothetical protein
MMAAVRSSSSSMEGRGIDAGSHDDATRDRSSSVSSGIRRRGSDAAVASASTFMRDDGA